MGLTKRALFPKEYAILDRMLLEAEAMQDTIEKLENIKSLIKESFECVLEEAYCDKCRYCSDTCVEIYTNIDTDELAQEILNKIQELVRVKK